MTQPLNVFPPSLVLNSRGGTLWCVFESAV